MGLWWVPSCREQIEIDEADGVGFAVVELMPEEAGVAPCLARGHLPTLPR